jgi:hypothetical protein
MPRKTVEVADLLERVNTYLNGDFASEEAKAGACSVLESVLHDTGNYKGFGYTHGYQGQESFKRIYAIHPRIREEYELYQEQRRRNGGLR